MNTSRKVLSLADYNASDPYRSIVGQLDANGGQFIFPSVDITEKVALSLLDQYLKSNIGINGETVDKKSILETIKKNKENFLSIFAKTIQDKLKLNNQQYAALDVFIQTRLFSQFGLLEKLKELMLGASLSKSPKVDGKFTKLNIIHENHKLFLEVEISDVTIETSKKPYQAKGVIAARCELNLVKKESKEEDGEWVEPYCVEVKFESVTPSTKLLKTISLHAGNTGDLNDWMAVEELKELSDKTIRDYEKKIDELDKKRMNFNLSKSIDSHRFEYQFSKKDTSVANQEVSKKDSSAPNKKAASIPMTTNPYVESIKIAKQKLEAVKKLRATLNFKNAAENLSAFRAKHKEISEQPFYRNEFDKELHVDVSVARETTGRSETPIMQKTRDSIWSSFINGIQMIFGWRLGITDSAHYMESAALIFNRGVKHKAPSADEQRAKQQKTKRQKTEVDKKTGLEKKRF